MKTTRLLIVEDQHALAHALAATVEKAGATCDLAATAAQARKRLQSGEENYVGMILDIGLPDQNGLEFLNSLGGQFTLPTIIITAHGEIQNTIAARKLGVVDFYQKPIDFDAFNQCLLRLIKAAREDQESADIQPADSAAYIGAARSMQPVFQQIAHCCASEEPVLIRGETGSGKSHTARVIRNFGLRKPGNAPPLVISPSTTIDELNHSLEENERSVLIIENIALLADPLQAELVRKMETQAPEVFPRIIATTSESLHQAVTDGRFRGELFYRLQVLDVLLPPLRQRIEDLPALVSFFLGQLKPGCKVSVNESAMDLIATHNWPGNLRELHNVMAFALTVNSEATTIDQSHLPEYLLTKSTPDRTERLTRQLITEMNLWLDHYFESTDEPRYRDIESDLNKALIEQLLERYDGKLAPMATALNANRSTLRRKLRE